MNSYKVPIKNALFMYSYIWDRTRKDEIIDLSDKDDFNFSDLYAELFLMNIKKIIKKGLHREYVNRHEDTSAVRGRIDYRETITKQALNKGKVYCDFDEYEENNQMNQILKYTAILIYKSKGISQSNKKRLRNVIGLLSSIDYKECSLRDFAGIRLNRNNEYYLFILKICELIIKSSMLNEEDGSFSFYNIFEDDEEMHNVFELFVYRFYEQELPKNYKVRFQHQMKFNVEGDDISRLPVMKMDTEVISDTEDIIIDTKYYRNYLQSNQGNEKFISSNIYQMMAYLNNINTDRECLRGILLYPKPYDGESVSQEYKLSVVSAGVIKPATIEFITIDLGKDWEEIASDMKGIIKKNGSSIF